MNYDVLNNIIDAYIRRNGQQAITGEVLNGVLDMMVSELGSGYQFGGVVAPSTPFEGGDSRLFFLAFEEGIYPSFGGIEVAKGQLAVITYDTEFNAQYIEGLGGGGGVFVAQYGVTTLAEVQEAFAEGLPVFAIRGNALYTLSNSAGADGAYFARVQGSTLYYLTLGESWYFGTIVLPTADDVADMVKFTPQTLTPAQQTQARNNIDAASKAQVTRIALNVGFTDKIKDTATTLEDLSNKVSIINVIDGDRIAGCILPSSQTGQIGWLYEFEEGWMLTKDVSSYEVGEHTWEDLLWYLDANSGKIVNAIRLALITGDLSTLTTTDKSTLVAAINEVKQGGGSEWELLVDHITTEVTRDVRLTLPRPYKHIRILCQGLASGSVYFGTNGGIENGYIAASNHIYADISTSETFGEFAAFYPLATGGSGAYIRYHLISPSDANFQAIFNAARVYTAADIPIGTKISVYGI